MNVITLKLPAALHAALKEVSRQRGLSKSAVVREALEQSLHAALKEVSRQRGLSKSAVVREALEQSLLAQGVVAAAAECWVAQWQGKLSLPAADSVRAADPRLAQLLDKHVR